LLKNPGHVILNAAKISASQINQQRSFLRFFSSCVDPTCPASNTRFVKKLSHYDEKGRARMVDVTTKPETARVARAAVLVRMNPRTRQAVRSNPKGDPLEIARIAGIAAAKRTAELIPMCHPLLLTHIDVQAKFSAEGVRIESEVRTTGPTGVEMEALTAAALAALTVYDMCKALDKGIEITDLRLLEKAGGKSGHYRRSADQNIGSHAREDTRPK
jgi:cyclic pyranopterin monophosphate synthase